MIIDLRKAYKIENRETRTVINEVLNDSDVSVVAYVGANAAVRMIITSKGFYYYDFIILPIISFISLAARKAVIFWKSLFGLYSTISAPTILASNFWIIFITSLEDKPPGSLCETPGA